MAITNLEIIRRQLKRINEKAGTDIQLENFVGTWLLTASPKVREITTITTYRTPEQMIEYLAGFEDAIDYYTKQKE